MQCMKPSFDAGAYIQVLPLREHMPSSIRTGSGGMFDVEQLGGQERVGPAPFFLVAFSPLQIYSSEDSAGNEIPIAYTCRCNGMKNSKVRALSA